MIYETVKDDEPIKQGDIFYPLPLHLIDLNNISILNEKGENVIKNWEEIKEEEFVVSPVILKKTWGIVASQDCDNLRSPSITFFEIGKFSDISRLTQPSNAKGWVKVITKHSRQNSGCFYLPADESIGFNERMAVNFEHVLQITRESLESKICNLRKAKLNEVANEHFRECIAQFFRRYPYDEWYPLTKEEYDYYNQENEGSIKPFPWQEK